MIPEPRLGDTSNFHITIGDNVAYNLSILATNDLKLESISEGTNDYVDNIRFQNVTGIGITACTNMDFYWVVANPACVGIIP